MTKSKAKEEAKARTRTILEPHRRQAWLPVTVPGNPSMGSKYYGSPWLAEAEHWPSILGKPARFVLQLDVCLLPDPIHSLLGGKGLIQFFFQTSSNIEFPDDDAEMSLVRLVFPDSVPGAAVPQPEHLIDDNGTGQTPRTPRQITGWTEITDYPDYEDCGHLGIQDEIEALEDKSYEDIRSGIQCLAGDKLGGWPLWTQDNNTPEDSKGEKMIPFFQLDAGFFMEDKSAEAFAPNLFAADGTGHLFVSKSDPSEMKFLYSYS